MQRNGIAKTTYPGRGNTEFRARDNVCIAVRLTRDGRATRLHHTDTQRVALEAATKRQDRVGRLPPWLRKT